MQRGLDQIFIVHTGKDDRWKLGGPLCSDVETALRHWPHQIVSLQGSLQSNISSFIERHDIDLVVLGEDFPRQGGFQIVSVSEWVKSNITKPFIIIRQSAVRNERLRLSDQPEVGSPGRSYSLSLTPDSAPGRKVAIAYNSFTVGSRLMELAKRLILLPQDEIFIVHCFPFSKKVVKQTKNILRTIAMGLPVPGLTDEDVSEDNSVEFGAKELAGYSIHLNVVLRVSWRCGVAGAGFWFQRLLHLFLRFGVILSRMPLCISFASDLQWYLPWSTAALRNKVPRKQYWRGHRDPCTFLTDTLSLLWCREILERR